MGFLKKILKPSTRQWIAEGRSAGTSLVDLLHGYTYLRWSYLYIDVARGDHWLSRLFAPLGRWIEGRAARRVASVGSPGDNCSSPQNGLSFADTYHGKVVPLAAATDLIRVDRDISIECPEKVVPFPIARDIVMKNPDHIVVLDCPCRDSRPDPCKPLDVCLIVGDPFATFVEEHHPRRSRRINRDEAETILKEEDERGHVHHAFFKDAMLGRFYAICNCCSCCCGAMQAHQHGSRMLASSGYVAQVDDLLCQVCGDCNAFCQFGALETRDLSTQVDVAACMGCGVCTSKCAYGAIELVRDPSRGDPLEITRLIGDAADPRVPSEMQEMIPASFDRSARV